MAKKTSKLIPNNVQRLREELLMSKAELARKAGLSPLTIDRVENGMSCRMDTKRKIILALGLKLSDKDKVFGDALRARIQEGMERRAAAQALEDDDLEPEVVTVGATGRGRGGRE